MIIDNEELNRIRSQAALASDEKSLKDFELAKYYDQLRTSVFPIFHKVGEVAQTKAGLTKREYFAGLALQGLLASGMQKDLAAQGETSVNQAIAFADWLLAELECSDPEANDDEC